MPNQKGEKHLAATQSQAAWQAAVDDLAESNATLEMARLAHDHAKAAYLQFRPKRPIIEEIRSADLDTIEKVEVWIAAVEKDNNEQAKLEQGPAGLAEADEAWQTALDNQAISAESLILCPAPDIAAVTYKIEVAKSVHMELADLDPVMADLRRLSRE